MFRTLIERSRQGHRTGTYPKTPAELPDRFRGRPVIDTGKCPDGCQICAEACPTDAVFFKEGKAQIDLGKCLFCSDCLQACPQECISYSRDHQLAARRREDLIIGFDDKQQQRLEVLLDEKIQKLFGRSLKLRQVSAGGCNACEADINVLGTIGWDIGRFGIQLVASPRHADGLLITGPVTQNMSLALKKTYDAVPDPKLVIAVGACAISGGPFAGHPEQHDGADSLVPVDLYIPGCPPHPYTILDGLLRLLGKIEE